MTPAQLTLTADRAAANAGESVVLTATVANPRAERHQFTLRIQGVDPTWVTFRPPVVSVEPGGQAAATATIATPADAYAADLVVALQLVSRQTGQVAAEASVPLRLNGRPAPAAEPDAGAPSVPRRGWIIGAAALLAVLVVAAGGWFFFVHGSGTTQPAQPTRQLGPPGTACAPSGTKILSLFSDDQTTTIRMSDADTTHLRILRSEPANILPGLYSTLLALSQDDSRVAYVTAVDEAMDDAHIYAFDVADPSKRVELAAIPKGFWNVKPAWSPDGKTLAFVRLNDQAAAQGQTVLELWVAEFGGTARKVAAPPQLQPEDFSLNPTVPLCWAEDNKTVIFPNAVRAASPSDQGTRSAGSVTTGTGTAGAAGPTGAAGTAGAQTEIPAGVQQTQVDVTSGQSTVTERPPEAQQPPPPPSDQGQPATVGGAAACTLDALSQNDPRWRNAIMQSAGDNIGNFGCALTSTAMVLNYYGANTDPPHLNSCLGQFADLLYWGQAVRCSNGAVAGNVNFDFSWQNLDQVLASGQPAIVGMVRGQTGMHFIVVTAGGGGDASNYAVTDPWDATTNKTLRTFLNSGYNLRWIQTYQGRDKGCVRVQGAVAPADNPGGVTLPSGSPLAPAQLMPFFTKAAQLTGVPQEVLLAIAKIESGFTPRAQGPLIDRFAGTEDAHALGMMQFLPSTYRGLMAEVDKTTGKNLGPDGIYDPESAIYAAAFYLRNAGAPGDLRKAIFAYNNADWYVDQVLKLAQQYKDGTVLDDTIFDANSSNPPGTLSNPNPTAPPNPPGTMIPTAGIAILTPTPTTPRTATSGTSTIGTASASPSGTPRGTATVTTTRTATSTATSTAKATVTTTVTTTARTGTPTAQGGTKTPPKKPTTRPIVAWSMPDGGVFTGGVKVDAMWWQEIGEILSAQLYTLQTPNGPAAGANQTVPTRDLVPGMVITEEGVYQAAIVTRLDGQIQTYYCKFTIDHTPPQIDVNLVNGVATRAGVTTSASTDISGIVRNQRAGNAPASKGPAVLNIAYQDTLSGVASVEYRLDGGDWKPLLSSAQFKGQQTFSAPGDHTISLRATDMVGNVSPIRTFDFTVLPADATTAPPTSAPTPTPLATRPTRDTPVPGAPTDTPAPPTDTPVPASATPVPPPTPVPPAGATAAPPPTSAPANAPTVTPTLAPSATASRPPATLKLPQDITAEATSADGAKVTYTATAVDSAQNPVPVTCDPASDTVFKLGTTTVTCTAKDSAGNVSTGTFKVTVQDTKPPTLTIPNDMAVEGNTKGGAILTFTVSATDAVDGSVPVTCTPKSGDFFKIGTATVTCTAKDKAGNTATGSFKVTVQDTTPPVVQVPADMNLQTTSPGGTVATFTATATDVVDGTDPVTCAPASGSTFKPGTTTVTCTAKDAAGNVGTGTFRVIVKLIDTTPPVINAPQSLDAGGDGLPVKVTYTVTATDNVDGPVPVSCSPPPGSTFQAGNTTVTCTASDAAGNKATKTFVVSNFSHIG